MKEAHSFLGKPGFRKKGKKIATMQKLDDIRKRLIQWFLSLVLRSWSSSNVGKQLQDCYDGAERRSVIEHCLGGKQTLTLSTRLSPIRGYLCWLDQVMADIPGDFDYYMFDQQWGNRGFPLTEPQGYKYVLSTKSTTAAKRFIETMGFLRGVFGFDLTDILSSERIHGYACIRLGQIGAIRKARAAPDPVLPMLEILCCFKDAPVEERISAANSLRQ